MKKLLGYSILISLLVIFSHSVAYPASFYYVDNSVASNGNGSIGSPWKNLSNINWTTISGASKACTIYISGGATSQTYNEALLVGASGSSSTWPYSGTPTGEIVIKRPSSAEWPGHSGIVYIRNTAAGVGYAISVDSRSNIILDGLDFRNTYNASDNVGLSAFNCDHIVVINCTSQLNQGSTILMYHCDYLTVSRCTLGIIPGQQGSYWGDDVIGVNGSYFWLEYTNIHCGIGAQGENGPHADGLHFGNGGTTYVIRYNRFTVTDMAYSILLEPDQNEASPRDIIRNVYVYGNTFEKVGDTGTNANTAGMGVAIWGDSPTAARNATTVYIYNNTFINNNHPGSGPGWAIEHAVSNANARVEIKNNIFYNSKVLLKGGNGSVTNAMNKGPTLVMDYNLYYDDGSSPSSSGYILGAGDTGAWYATITAFRTANSNYYAEHEQHGQQGNLNLASVSGTLSTTHDLRPTASSTLLLGMGTVITPITYGTYDYGLSMDDVYSSWPSNVTLTSRGTAYAIGAYQYSGAKAALSAPTNLRLVQ